MKKYFIFLLLSCFFFSVSAQDQFVVTGKFKGLPAGTQLILEKLNYNVIKQLDTSKVATDGSFTLKAIADEDGLYRVRLSEAISMLMVVKPSDKKITLDTDTGRIKEFEYNVTGSYLTEQVRDLVIHYNKQMDIINDVATQLQTPLLSDSMRQQLEMQLNIYNSLTQQYIQSFLDTVSNPVVAAFGALSFIDVKSNTQFITKLEKRLFDNFKDNSLVRDFVMHAEEIKKQMQPAVSFPEGTTPPDISMSDTSGKKTLSLYSLRGKYVLIDFWASWCGPCRAENPNVVSEYNTYKDKGFTVFSVSLDSNRDKWIAAIKKDKLSWQWHVSQLQGWQSPICQTYKITSIPSNFLLDKEGKVIGVNLRGEALGDALKKIFSEKH